MAKDLEGKELPEGITQRKDGRYMGRFRHEGERYTVYDNELKKCVKKLNNLKYEVEHGLYAKETNVTVSSWFKTWIREYKEPTVKVGTVQVYKDNYKSYIEKPLGRKKLKSVRPEHIQKLYNDMNKKGYSRNTIELVSVVLSGMYKQALKNQIIIQNPVPLATLPRQYEDKKPRVLTVKEQKIFLEYAKESYLYNLYLVLLTTGLRSGEARGLQWNDDIDLKNKVLHVNHTLIYAKDGGYQLGTPKTKSSIRDVPLIDKAIKTLKHQKVKQAKERMLLGEKWRGKEGLEDLVFTSETGKLINRDRLKVELDRVVEAIQKDHKEFEHITPHTLRHTFATRAIENGMSPQVLKTILGHSKLSMTMDLYSHVLPNTKAKEMQRIADIF